LSLWASRSFLDFDTKILLTTYLGSSVVFDEKWGTVVVPVEEPIWTAGSPIAQVTSSDTIYKPSTVDYTSKSILVSIFIESLNAVYAQMLAAYLRFGRFLTSTLYPSNPNPAQVCPRKPGFLLLSVRPILATIGHSTSHLAHIKPTKA
jgi:hypothetical protein